MASAIRTYASLKYRVVFAAGRDSRNDLVKLPQWYPSTSINLGIVVRCKISDQQEEREIAGTEKLDDDLGWNQV